MDVNSKLITILKAIQEAKKVSSELPYINLYPTKASGLNDFDPNEIWDILHNIEKKEKVLAIEGVPMGVDIHAGYDAEYVIHNSRTYFLLKLNNSFDKWILNKYPNLTSKSSPERLTYSFDSERGILTINGTEIKFNNEGRRIPYIELLSNSKDYAHHSEVAEELEGAEQIKKAKPTYYEVCRGIQNRLLKFGITDFLEYDYNRARINPSYKKIAI